ncbi:FixH family protein [Bacillus sp. JCM 19034]|uniref:FixH family protein n=1 Tax=Bacillus sp. JCM 19034 TaxID=1481928 RepID=UPI00078457CA|nr:FixH family protein [Bacillus sp. JCM 19034]
MKKVSWSGIMILISLLVACGGEEPEELHNDGVPEVVEVEILLPEIEPGEEVVLATKVTQGQENVEDAQEVEFEIWEHDNKVESEMISGEHQGEGIYEISYTFVEDGIYHVTSHVTARGMHVMPTEQVIVGDVSEEELEKLEEESAHDDSEEHDHQHHQ